MQQREKVLCVVSGGIGDHVMTLPALKALSSNLRKHTLEIRIAHWHRVAKLLQVLTKTSLPLESLDSLWRTVEEPAEARYCDWLLNFFFRGPAGSVIPSWVTARRGVYEYPQDRIRLQGNNCVTYFPPGFVYWKWCLNAAYEFMQEIEGKEYSETKLDHPQNDLPYASLPEPPKKVRQLLADLFSDDGPNPGNLRLMVSPGGYHPRCKRWPPNRFVEVIDFSRSRAIDVFVHGSNREVELAQHIMKLLKDRRGSELSGRLTFIVGTIDLHTLPYVLQRMDLHLTNDNGAAHIGGALNKPQIVLYLGSSSASYTIGSRDVRLFSGNDLDMSGISTHQVIDAVYGVLGKHGSSKI